MAVTHTPVSQHQPDWRRVDAAGALIVAAVSAAAFILLISLTDASAFVAFGGVLVALDLPACLYIIWRGARKEDRDRNGPDPTTVRPDRFASDTLP